MQRSTKIWWLAYGGYVVGYLLGYTHTAMPWYVGGAIGVTFGMGAFILADRIDNG